MPLQQKSVSIWLMAAFVLFAVGMLLLWHLIETASERQDQTASQLYHQQVASALEHEIRALGDHAKDSSFWDIAIEKLLKQYDPDWADSNIGSYLDQHFGIPISLVADANNRFLLGFADSEPLQQFDRFTGSASLETLITQARAASVQLPEGASGLVEIQGHLYLAGVGAFTSEVMNNQVDAVRSGDMLSVLIYLKRLDADFLVDFSNEFTLELDRITPSAGPDRVTLTSINGKPLGYLKYLPPKPGSGLLESMLKPVLLFAAVLLLMYLFNTLLTVSTSRLNLQLAQQKDQLERANKELVINHQIIRSIKEAVIVTDAQERVSYINPAFTRITGYLAEDVIGKPVQLHHDDSQNQTMLDELRSTLDHQSHWEQETWWRRKSGERYPISLSVTPIVEQGQKSLDMVGIFSDITVRKQQERALAQLANNDALTALPNRRSFQRSVEQKLQRAARHPGSRLALLFIDLDLFKEVNDTLGHEAGDQLLIEISQRIHHCLRPYDELLQSRSDCAADQQQAAPFSSGSDQADSIVARVGGDEFTAIIDDLQQPADIEQISARLLERIEQPLTLSGKQVAVTASIGVALYPEDGDSYADLIRHADQAMYHSKNSGRNRSSLYSQSS